MRTHSAHGDVMHGRRLRPPGVVVVAVTATSVPVVVVVAVARVGWAPGARQLAAAAPSAVLVVVVTAAWAVVAVGV